MCMLLHRYTVFVILFANGIPFYNSGLVFDHIHLSIYALQCYMYLSKKFKSLNHFSVFVKYGRKTYFTTSDGINQL